MAMRVVHERAAGADVHKRDLVVCAITPAKREVRTFGTMTEDLLVLVEWLEELGITDVAMESTGVYWKPVFNVLEAAGMRPVLGNARQLARVPGRKTDVKDAEWIAELHRHGLVPASYVPARDQRELRELVRYRRSLVQERTREANRLQKLLEGANIKLASVASDVLGISGRAMLQSLIAGEQDVEKIAALAKGKLRDKSDQLVRSLRGVVGRHQRFLLAEQLAHIEEVERRIARLDAEVEQRLSPFADALERLDAVPGLGQRGIQDIVAEIGTDMSRFPSDRHLASWARICPGSNESAGKQRGAPAGPGNKWLHHALNEAAKAAGRSRNTFLGAMYRRLSARIGSKKATVAVGHAILRIVYFMLRDGTPFRDLGHAFHDERSREVLRRTLQKRLERLDFQVDITDTRVVA
jgi:transposase